MNRKRLARERLLRRDKLASKRDIGYSRRVGQTTLWAEAYPFGGLKQFCGFKPNFIAILWAEAYPFGGLKLKHVYAP